jgi:isopenicillin N synthase-like dioxygenase
VSSVVPVIDIGPFLDGTDIAGVAAAVDAACRDIGFFVITGHGVDLDLLRRTRATALEFFRLPLDVKAGGSEGSFMGYSPFKGERLAYSLGEETPPDLKEAYSIAQPDKGDGPYYTHPDAQQVFPDNIFPATPAAFEPVSVEYYRRLGALCATVAEVFAVALDLPQDYFAPHLDKHFSFLRYVYYPALTEPALPGQLRAGAHSDYGSFTLVNFDDAPGGMQVQTRDGDWIDVPVVGDSFVCNIGDLFEVWTNDRWVSTLHRVAIPADERWEDSERLSLVYFHEPNWDTVAEALPTCVSADNPPRYEPLTAGEHNRRKVMRQQTLEVADAS